MRIPTFTLERRKFPRVVFSVLPHSSPGPRQIYFLMEKAYRMGLSYFDLPSSVHLESLRDLRSLTEDQELTGLCHMEAEQGVSFLGKPLHRFEGKVISTIKRNLPPQLIQHFKAMGVWNQEIFFPPNSSSEVFTQKEVDKLCLDLSRFDKALSLFQPEESPFLMLGGKYTDWLSAMGRVDLLKEMSRRIRGRGFIPIFSARWASFILPKAKSVDAAAFAIPVNKKWALFDPAQTCTLIKQFDRPVISLNPFADGRLIDDSEGALSFLFKELKVHGAIADVGSEEEGKQILNALEKFPSVIPPRKT